MAVIVSIAIGVGSYYKNAVDGPRSPSLADFASPAN